MRRPGGVWEFKQSEQRLWVRPGFPKPTGSQKSRVRDSYQSARQHCHHAWLCQFACQKRRPPPHNSTVPLNSETLRDPIFPLYSEGQGIEGEECAPAGMSEDFLESTPSPLTPPSPLGGERENARRRARMLLANRARRGGALRDAGAPFETRRRSERCWRAVALHCFSPRGRRIFLTTRPAKPIFVPR